MTDIGGNCPGALGGTAENYAIPSTKHAFHTSPVFVSSFEKITLIGLETKVKAEVCSNLKCSSYKAVKKFTRNIFRPPTTVVLQLMFSIKVLLESTDSMKNEDLEDL